MTVLFTFHLLVCAMMTGLIWEIQRVHYPMFNALKQAPHPEFMTWINFHIRRIQPIVGPLMLAEAGSGVLLVITETPTFPQWLGWINLVLIGLIFGVTALVSVPAFGSLRREGDDQVVIDRLIRYNWIRTAAWNIRLMILGFYAYTVILAT